MNRPCSRSGIGRGRQEPRVCARPGRFAQSRNRREGGPIRNPEAPVLLPNFRGLLPAHPSGQAKRGDFNRGHDYRERRPPVYNIQRLVEPCGRARRVCPGSCRARRRHKVGLPASRVQNRKLDPALLWIEFRFPARLRQRPEDARHPLPEAFVLRDGSGWAKDRRGKWPSRGESRLRSKSPDRASAQSGFSPSAIVRQPVKPGRTTTLSPAAGRYSRTSSS